MLKKTQTSLCDPRLEIDVNSISKDTRFIKKLVSRKGRGGLRQIPLADLSPRSLPFYP